MGVKAKPCRNLNELVESVKMRQQRNYDTVIVNLGDEGKGKSTLSFKLAKKINPDFQAEQMVFQAEKMVGLAKSMPRGSLIVLDEAIDGAFSRDAMAKANKDFVKFLTVCRELTHTLIINIPDWFLLDSSVRKRAHYAILVEKRGLAKAHVVYKHDYKRADASLFDMFRFKFDEAKDPEWLRYRAMKEEFVRERDEAGPDSNRGNGPRDLTKTEGFVRLVDIAGLAND